MLLSPQSGRAAAAAATGAGRALPELLPGEMAGRCGTVQRIDTLCLTPHALLGVVVIEVSTGGIRNACSLCGFARQLCGELTSSMIAIEI